MPRNTSARDPKNSSITPFAGFALPTSNTTYTPNQFFDACLPHYSRGVVRLVGYMLRKTLGWCDEQGNPQAEQHRVSYADFERAGISREMIRDSIEQAVHRHFIRCVRPPRSQKAGQTSVSGLYELAWDERTGYAKKPGEFRGFFAGEGNRTYIPNQFFDHVLPHETLAVVKVVGSVIRFSIGFQNKWGHRRQQVAMSYQDIQNYSHIRNRATLSQAIGIAMKRNYIQRVEEGYFDPDAGRLSKAAVYAVKWLNPADNGHHGQKNVPGKTDASPRSEIRTGNGRKNVPGERSEIRTDIQIKQTNNTFKQQEAVGQEEPVAPEDAVTFSRLKAEGFDARAARTIASRYPLERVERQIGWIDGRKIKSNRLGMLRRAIEQDWPAPAGTEKLQRRNSAEDSRPSGVGFTDALEETSRRLLDHAKSYTS